MGIPIVKLPLPAILALIATAAIVAGVVLLAGIAWGLITVGVSALAAAILLYDPTGQR